MSRKYYQNRNLINMSMFVGLPLFVIGFFVSNQHLLSSQNKPSQPATINTELLPSINNPINPEFNKPLIQASTPLVNIQLPSDIEYRHVPSINGKYHGTLLAGTQAVVTDDRRISQGFLEIETSIQGKLERVWIEINQEI